MENEMKLLKVLNLFTSQYKHLLPYIESSEDVKNFFEEMENRGIDEEISNSVFEMLYTYGYIK